MDEFKPSISNPLKHDFIQCRCLGVQVQIKGEWHDLTSNSRAVDGVLVTDNYNPMLDELRAILEENDRKRT